MGDGSVKPEEREIIREDGNIKTEEKAFISEASDVGSWSRVRRYWWPTQPAQVVAQLKAEEWRRQHDETGKTIFWAMVTVAVFSLFCLATLVAPDFGEVLNRNEKIELPTLNIKIPFTYFLLVGPVVLIALTVYQHIFIGYQRALGASNEHRALPFIFTLPNRSERVISGFLFYWLVPLVLFAFSCRTSRLVFIGSLLVFMTAIVTAMLVWVQIRRHPPARRRGFWRGFGYHVLWVVEGMLLLVVIAQAVILSQYNVSLLGYVRADLFKESQDLSRTTRLEGANLSGTYLKGINLQGANLQGTNWEGTITAGANLKGADLRGATNLTQRQIDNAKTDATTMLPDYLTLPPPSRDLSDFEKKAESRVKDFINAYNTYFQIQNVTNLERLMDFWADGSQLVYPTVTLQNKQEIRDRYNQVSEDKDWGNRMYIPERQVVQGNVVAWEGRWEAAYKPLKNQKVKLPIVIMFELDPQAQIKHERHFYDEASLQRELQLPRPK